MALADLDNNRSTEDKPTDKVKEKKQSKKQKETSQPENQKGVDNTLPTGGILDLTEFDVEQATTLADDTCKDVKLSRQIWSPPKIGLPGTKTATKLVPPGINLVAVIVPPWLFWFPPP